MEGPERLERGHRLYLWRCYSQQQDDGGPPRDRLPYTSHFEIIALRVNTKYDKHYTHQQIFAEISYLDRHREEIETLMREAAGA